MHSAGTPLRSADLAAAAATIRLTLAVSQAEVSRLRNHPQPGESRNLFLVYPWPVFLFDPPPRPLPWTPGIASLPQLPPRRGKHLVLLRDGRTLIGYLRSIDQFANLVLHQTVERIHVGKKYGDIPRGIFVVRGENVVLLGEIDLEKESDTPLQQVSIEEILEEQRVEQQAKQESEKLKVQALKERGLSVPRADTLDEY
uniref:U6 snRNA-associated Sm-like protein LSm1 n=1 Tax=Apteryx owenii TaxID=8824 RepID=A0A8B9NZ10_APTOW